MSLASVAWIPPTNQLSRFSLIQDKAHLWAKSGSSLCAVSGIVRYKAAIDPRTSSESMSQGEHWIPVTHAVIYRCN
jgi:hypothetical protein